MEPALPTRIYLDHAATTPIVEAARSAMADAFDAWANPSSAHGAGRSARARLEDARTRVAAAFGWVGDVVFTGGATEALAIALTRTPCDRRIVAATEHAAVHRAAPAASRIPVGGDGLIDVAALAGLLSGAARPLVCVQSVNSETGVVHPLEEIATLVRDAGGVLLSDCSQSAGKLPLPDADMVVVAAHKLGGPPGVGALLVRHAGAVEAIGGQEDGIRPGTHNLPGIAGLVAALEADRSWFEGMATLRDRLDLRLLAAGAEIVAGARTRIPTIGAYRMPGVSGAAQLMHMDLAAIAVSAGSACSSGAVRPSQALAAMGWPEALAAEVLRISFGRDTDADDIDACAAAWEALAMRRRAA